ncbi:MAG: ATP-grasp domain-containing protein [Deltaproteobacteria bacterium]|nr:ATP-grasp domain-containing protein [Deltaproteobacteria bacterium]
MLSVELGVADGRYVCYGIGERKRDQKCEALELGTTMPAPISAAEARATCDYAVRVVQALGLDRGIFHIEIMLTKDGPRLIEANPRLIGGTGPRMLWHGCGINIYELLIAIFLGQPPASPPAWHTAVTSRFLGCAVPSVMPHFDLGAWQRARGDGLAECVVYRDAGECLPALQSNHDYFGHLIARADTPEAACLLADQLVDALAHATGLH